MARGSRGETHYIVVTRTTRLPISRHAFLEDAANKIVRDRNYGIWTVIAQDGDTPSAPTRPLTRVERVKLEKRLWPTLNE